MAASIRASEKGLQIVDQARRKKGWTKKATAWCDAAGSISPSTLDRFWARTPVSQESFVAICIAVGEDWETIADLQSSDYSFPQVSTYNQQTWVGRESLIADLLPKLQGQTRSVWITGISGIGKTALGECLASQAWESDPAFQWIYLEILEGQSPDFPSVAAELLDKLGDRDLDPQERNNPDQLAKRLLHKLRSHSYWIQLDSLERLLHPEHPSEFVDPYWTTFLQRCLTESAFAGRLVLTSQAFPHALVEFNDRYPNVWAEIQLDGLLQVEQQLEFFAKRGITVDPSNQTILAQIAKIYEGHPLVLKVIAEDILDPQEFAGDVARYWQVNQPEFEQVARDLQAARLDETAYNEALDRKVRDRIRQSLEQLPTDALDLLCRSSVYRRPVPKTFWLAMIGDRSPQQQKTAYRVLGDRALVEKEGTNIRQHNLIRDIAYDLLRQDSTTWETVERKAADLWLTAYKPEPDVSNLEKVRKQIEAFHHYGEVNDWESASEIYMGQTGANQQAFHGQLLIWGYYKELLQISNKLVGKTTARINRICLNQLGNAYTSLGNVQKSIEYYQQVLNLSREMGDRQGEGVALGNLGVAYKKLGNYEQAIDFYQQSLAISREIGDRHGEGQDLGNLGNAYNGLGNYERAIEFHQQCLAIVREIGARHGEGIALGNLGVAYKKLGNYEQAIECYQQYLMIARDIGDRLGEGTALGNLGATYYSLRNYERAIEFHQQYLVIARDIGDRLGEGTALGGLGVAYLNLGNYERAIEFHQQYLVIARGIGDRRGEGVALINLGVSQLKLEQYTNALGNCQIALEIFQAVGDRAAEAETYKNLAELHQKTGSIDLAQQNCDRALALAIELGIPLQEECRSLQSELNKEVNHDESGRG
jgi:tetratricopeptide (TPR) repeat protein